MSSSDFIIIISLVLMEGILSIDNAAVLATMVKHLKPEDQGKALKYGILGAYLFRGIFLIFAAWIIKFAWLKLLGGAYLLYLAIKFFTKSEEHDETQTVTGHSFWMTVVWVEIMDITFSLDNVLAAVAMSSKLWVIMIGVAIGILAMRFVAGKFVALMQKYPDLETSAYLVIGMLGIKLCLGFLAGILGFHGLEEVVEGHYASMITSGLTLVLFSIPFLKNYVSRS